MRRGCRKYVWNLCSRVVRARGPRDETRGIGGVKRFLQRLIDDRWLRRGHVRRRCIRIGGKRRRETGIRYYGTKSRGRCGGRGSGCGLAERFRGFRLYRWPGFRNGRRRGEDGRRRGSRFLGGGRRHRFGYRIRSRRGDLGWGFRPRDRRRRLRSGGRFGGFDFLRGPRCRDGGELLNGHGLGAARCWRSCLCRRERDGGRGQGWSMLDGRQKRFDRRGIYERFRRGGRGPLRMRARFLRADDRRPLRTAANHWFLGTGNRFSSCRVSNGSRCRRISWWEPRGWNYSLSSGSYDFRRCRLGRGR